MGVTIHVNGTSNSLVHKGSMGIAKSTLPDVCKTPSPGGPVPVPYPVIVSMSNTLKKGTKTVKVDGKKMAAVKGSELSRCNGDEPGTAGGVKSSTNMKEATWLLYSFDVKLDGKNACRLSDKMMMNHGNTACLGGVLQEPLPGDAGCSEVLRHYPVKEHKEKCPEEGPNGTVMNSHHPFEANSCLRTNARRLNKSVPGSEKFLVDENCEHPMKNYDVDKAPAICLQAGPAGYGGSKHKNFEHGKVHKALTKANKNIEGDTFTYGQQKENVKQSLKEGLCLTDKQAQCIVDELDKKNKEMMEPPELTDETVFRKYPPRKQPSKIGDCDTQPPFTQDEVISLNKNWS